MHISSTKNQQIKFVKQLQSKAKLRQEEGLFVVEGVREITMALHHKYQFEKIFICLELYSHHIDFDAHTEVISISKLVYEQLAYRSGTEGILGICKSLDHSLKNVRLKNNNPLVLVLESPEKPGNIGAILRSADAAQVDLIIIANPITDLYNPNTIRSSLGAVFSNHIAVCTSEQAYHFLSQNQFHIYGATLQNSNSYLLESYKSKTAFVMGSEAKGLSDFWRTQPDFKAVNIPMFGKIDSLNLSVSTAILTFEAIRQRNILE